MLTNTVNGCANVIKIQSAEVSGTNLVLNSDNLITPINGKRYCLSIPTSILPTEASTSILQLYVNISDTNVPLQCRIGNDVYTDQIKCMEVNNCGNIVLRVIFGTTPAHFKILNTQLCNSIAYSETL